MSMDDDLANFESGINQLADRLPDFVAAWDAENLTQDVFADIRARLNGLASKIDDLMTQGRHLPDHIRLGCQRVLDKISEIESFMNEHQRRERKTS